MNLQRAIRNEPLIQLRSDIDQVTWQINQAAVIRLINYWQYSGLPERRLIGYPKETSEVPFTVHGFHPLNNTDTDPLALDHSISSLQ